MPNIIQYQQRTTPQASYATPRAAALNTGGGNIAGEIADALSGMLANQAKREEEAGRAWAIDAVSQARLEWTSRLQDRQASAVPGAQDFTQQFITEFDEYAAEALKNAPNAPAKKYFHERLADIRTSLGEKAIGFEAAARVDYRDNQFSKAIENNQKLMMTDPGQFDVALAETLTVIKESALPPKQRADMEQKAIIDVASAAVWSQMTKSPVGFMQSIGMVSADPNAKLGAGAVEGKTGNKAFDLLPFKERVSMISKAMALRNTMESDAEQAAEKLRKEKGDEMMKEALSRLDPQPGSPRLDREFIEAARPWVSPAEYKSLIQMSRGGIQGESTSRSDPGTFRHLQALLRDDPERAQREAFTAHANGMLTNSDLSSITGKAATLDRQGGPKTTYERVRQYVTGSLDPGPMVQDPQGRGRLASALNEFDKWVEGDGKTKRTDEEIERRGEEIIRQWRFVDFSNTAAALPQPRFGGKLSRGGSNFEARKAEIGAAANKAREMYNQKRVTWQEMADEMTRLREWLRLVSDEEREAKAGNKQ